MKLIFGLFLIFCFFSNLIFAIKKNHLADDISPPTITVNQLDGDIISLEYSGPTNSNVWALTQRTLYRSTNGGISFEDQQPRLPDCNSRQCVVEIVKSASDPSTLFFIGKDSYSWITNDNGDNFKRISFSDQVITYQFHPQRSDWSFVLQQQTNSDLFSLLVTTNNGFSWESVFTNVQFGSASWGSIEATNFEPTLLYAIYHTDSTSSLVSYDIQSKATTPLLKGAVEFIFMNNFMFVANLHSETESITLYSSVDNGKTLRKVVFPFNLPEKSYTIVDTTEGTAFFNVYHGQYVREPWGNVYSSDSSGSRYSLSLYRNRRTDFFDISSCDFHKIESLQGVYIANVVDNAKDESCKLCHSVYDCDSKCHYASKITFDKGGSWESLSPPAEDSNNQPITCPLGDKCYLHVHGFASLSHAPLLAHPNAVGIILATGNVGPYLIENDGEVNTYISRDGGFHWEEIKKGGHIYGTSDHGGLLLLAKNDASTNTLSYSYDQGISFYDIKFSNNSVFVRDIHSPPNETALTFLVEVEYGYKTQLVHVDFSNSLQNECKGFNMPGADDSDYQLFRPHAYNSGCLLGREMEYTRKIRDHRCFNPKSFEDPVNVRNCNCEIEDYECDFGYDAKEDEVEGTLFCIPQEGTGNPSSPPSNCKGTYEVTKGYRKVAGDTCVDGISSQYDPTVAKCPGTNTGTIIGISIAGFAILSLFFTLIFVFAFIIALKTSPRLREFINDKLPSRANIAYQPANQFGLDEIDENEDSHPAFDDEIKEEDLDDETNEPMDTNDKPKNNKSKQNQNLLDDDEFNPRDNR